MQVQIKSASKIRDIDPAKLKNPNYPKKIIGLELADGRQAEWFADASEDIPAPGAVLEGELEDGDYGLKFRVPFNNAPKTNGSAPAAPQTAPKGNSFSSEKDAKITRLAAQKAAVQICSETATFYELPEAEQEKLLKKWINWFVDDATGVRVTATLDDVAKAEEFKF